ncbi:MAG: CpXC domain-containing protein, partial [Spirochaetaceae bacterium]|nr:CpXC domain-containing protein [Spirochaetaceae bacterium]
FMTVICPACGTKLKPDLRVRLQSTSRSLDLLLLPELERLSFYRGAIPVPKGCQILIGFPELYERARIIADGLDPETLEIMKYYIGTKAEEESPEAEIAIAYSGRESAKLTFKVGGLKQGEIALLHVGEATYERTLAEKARTARSNPFERIFKGSYRSIRALEAETEGLK